ncbi:MAG TPA: D-alanine--D-alanine ligase [bacterium]
MPRNPAARPGTPGLQPVTVLLGDSSLPDPTKPSGYFAEEDFDTLARMREALESLGRYELRFLERHGTLFADLQAQRPDFVLNLCDTGYRNIPLHELHVAALLEMLEIPYSGAPPAAMGTCYDKGLVSALARAMGIPTTEERYFETAPAAAEALDTLALPALIKPNHADGSVGITAKAVVRSAGEARDYLDWLAQTLPGRSVLVQEYLPGPEYTVGLIGNPHTHLAALPVLEVDFSTLPADCAPICCYESKSVPDSPYWSGIGYGPARLPDAVRARIVADGRRLFKRLGLRDYGRVDFRTDAAGTVKLMEVNPNPAWAYDGKLNLMAKLEGRTYPHLLQAIVEAALARIAAEAHDG